jgi:hypothetical protein
VVLGEVEAGLSATPQVQDPPLVHVIIAPVQILVLETRVLGALFVEVPLLRYLSLIFLLIDALPIPHLDERVLVDQQVTPETRELLGILEFRQPLLEKHLWVEPEVTVEPEVMAEREEMVAEGVEFLYETPPLSQDRQAIN